MRHAAFAEAWGSLLAAAERLPDRDFRAPSGCAGWKVQDLLCHLVIDAQDILITLATPTDDEPTRDAATYWDVTHTLPSGRDPLDALTVRLAAAYEQPHLLKHHLDDVGSAAARAAQLAAPDLRVSTQGEVLTASDYLDAYVLEATLHHLDLTKHVRGVDGPPAPTLAASRKLFVRIVDASFPTSMSDTAVLTVGTGRRPATAAERAALGSLVDRLPYVLG
ncbi:maleylpyruvate isomerase N-terminal domain-containing protein [Mycobacterium aquaticum]|uniref:Maleylpyruvate isomerase n=1 Tax=Mycobacterium aquaticum TaxID=1927124 RepID=A0A1X0B8W4_9MYCO|nr:maleylpyruvate isomerase N-terminal domain-containing protein [Mycobacterium aquaticum]ORA38770.1 maleylpyruvate isomerase [Mycobacterium aquaticum]